MKSSYLVIIFLFLISFSSGYAQRAGRNDDGNRNSGSGRIPPVNRTENKPVNSTPPPAKVSDYQSAPQVIYETPQPAAQVYFASPEPLYPDYPENTSVPAQISESPAEANKLDGIDYYEKGEYDKALLAFCYALVCDSLDYELYLLRGSTNIKLKNYLWAISDLNYYIFRIPKDQEGYYYRGLAEYYYAEKGLAREDLEYSAALGSPSAKIFLKRFFTL